MHLQNVGRANSLIQYMERSLFGCGAICRLLTLAENFHTTIQQGGFFNYLLLLSFCQVDNGVKNRAQPPGRHDTLRGVCVRPIYSGASRRTVRCTFLTYQPGAHRICQPGTRPRQRHLTVSQNRRLPLLSP